MNIPAFLEKYLDNQPCLPHHRTPIRNNERSFRKLMNTTGKLQRKVKEFQFRRAEILDQAVKIFAAKGFHKTTMAQIAKASGFSTGSLYHFFRGKEDLYSVMVMEKVRMMYDEIMGAVSREPSIDGMIRALVISHFAYVEHHIDFYRLLVGHESGLRSEGLKKLRDNMLDEHRKHVEWIEDLLRDGIRQEVLRDLDTKSLANALMGIIAYSKFAWITNPSGASLLGTVDDVLDVFLRGGAAGQEVGQAETSVRDRKNTTQEAG
jgi:AcrR family transcriptional regulator